MTSNSDGIRFIVLGVVKNNKGEILLVRRAKEENDSNDSILHWSFPGGRLQVNESREECVRRHVREETGYDIRPLYQISVGRHPQIPVDVAYFFCLLNAEEPIAKPSQLDEIAEIKWVKLEEIKKYFTTNLDPKVAQELGINQQNSSSKEDEFFYQNK